MKSKRDIYSICKNIITGHPALSRKDNKTLICSNCGISEALETFIKVHRKEF